MAFRPSRTEVVVAASLALVFALGVLLWMYYPVAPRTGPGWVLLFVIGIPSWFFLQWLGDRVLGARFFAGMSSAARIALGVPVLILLMIIAALVIYFGGR